MIVFLKRHHRFFLLSILLCADVCVWFLAYHENHHGLLTVRFLDVAKGQSIFIEAPNGNKIIVDGGSDKQIFSELTALLPFYDRTISMLILTNPSRNYVSGFLSILDSYKVGAVLESGAQASSSAYTQFENIIGERHIPKILARRGMKIVLDANANEEVYLSVLFPDRDVSRFALGDSSIVMSLSYGGKSFLLQGSASEKIRKYLAVEGDEPL